MNLLETNIFNLTELWKIAGKHVSTSLYEYSKSSDGDWPNKIWFTQTFTQETLEEVLNNPSFRSFSISVWNQSFGKELAFLQEAGLKEIKQIGMSMNLETRSKSNSLFSCRKVTCFESAKTWSHLFNIAFRYEISVQTVINTMESADFYIGYHGGQEVGTALLFLDKNKVAGIHSMGIIPSQRRKGLARSFLSALLDIAKSKNAKTAVLQASKAGKPLYSQEGFQEDFSMHSFKIS